MPLYSDHITNMFYSGVPSYSSASYSYGNPVTPYGTSYSASYMNPGANYNSHSSLGGYSRAPYTSRWIMNGGRSYSPILSTISEKGSSSPIRINSPRRTPISKRNYMTPSYTSRPISINTADIDVSKDKYRPKENSSNSKNLSNIPSQRRSPSVEKSSNSNMPQSEDKPDIGIDSSPGPFRSTIKRDRTVVRLHTLKRKDRDSPRKPVDVRLIQNIESNNDVTRDTKDQENISEPVKWREKLANDLAYNVKKEKKSLGTKLVEKFKLRDIDESIIDVSVKISPEKCEFKENDISNTYSVNDGLTRRCSMELLAEQASLLDSLIRNENLSTVQLDLTKIGTETKEISSNNDVQDLTKKRKMSNKGHPLTTTKSDQSLHDRLNVIGSKDCKQVLKRRSLKKSLSGNSICKLDCISEFPKVENLITVKEIKPKIDTKESYKTEEIAEIPEVNLIMVEETNPNREAIENYKTEEISEFAEIDSLILVKKTNPTIDSKESYKTENISEFPEVENMITTQETKPKIEKKSDLTKAENLITITETKPKIKKNKVSKTEKIRPKLKTKITSTVEVSEQLTPIKFYVENVIVEEKPTQQKKDIIYSSSVDNHPHLSDDQHPEVAVKHRKSVKTKLKSQRNVNDDKSPEPEDGNFWDKIGKRETVYLIHRKQYMEATKEKNHRLLCWFPEEAENESNLGESENGPFILEDKTDNLSTITDKIDTITEQINPPSLSENKNNVGSETIEFLQNDIKYISSNTDPNICEINNIILKKELKEESIIHSNNDTLVLLVNQDISNIVKDEDQLSKDKNTVLLENSSDLMSPESVSGVLSNTPCLDIVPQKNDTCSDSLMSKAKSSTSRRKSKESVNSRPSSKIKIVKKIIKNKSLGIVSKSDDTGTANKKVLDGKLSEQKHSNNKGSTNSENDKKGSNTCCKCKKDIISTKSVSAESVFEDQQKLEIIPLKEKITKELCDNNNLLLPKLERAISEPPLSPVVIPIGNTIDCVTVANENSTSIPELDPKITNPINDSSSCSNNTNIENETFVESEKQNEKSEPAKETKVPPKKPVRDKKAPIVLIATPRPLQKKNPQIIHSSSSSDSSEDDSSETEDDSDESEDSAEFFECENNPDGRTSTGSNDSGFDSSAPASPAGFLYVKKGADNPSTSTSSVSPQACNPDIIEQELENSTTYGLFRKTGRFIPPARSIPRFRKYTIEDFQFIKVLGKGSFGKVMLAELRDTEYYYAVKCLKKDVVLEDDDVECTLIERKVLALGTNHPYLCHLFATFQTDSHLFFVMEYLNGGDLMFHIQQSGRFPEARARFYAAEIVSGLKFLHKRGIVYRDLKLDNILLDFDGHVRIADFGMCKLQIYLDKTADTFCGTPDYMAPEIIKGLKYTQTVDWWSFGVLLYEMLIGQSPFSGCDEDELFWSICNEMPSYPRFLSQDSHSILTRLLDKDARTRLGGAECMYGDIRDQDFFKAIHWEKLERRELDAPFKPRVRHPLDTQYFDRAFTGERPRLTAVEPQVLRSMDQEPFRGFSYTNPNATDR